MTLPTVLFIPDQFMDHRMWVDVPDRLGGHAEVVHFDQHAAIPWTAANEDFVTVARQLAAGGFDVVCAAGHAARFAFALAEAGLAKGLIFFEPSIDTIPDDADLAALDIDRASADDMLIPYEPLIDAVASRPGTSQERDILLQIIQATAEPGTSPADLETVSAMISDHAEDLFAALRSVAAAAAGEEPPPDPPWVVRPWIDRLAALTIPVTAVGAGFGVKAIERRAADAETVPAEGGGLLMAPEAGRAQAGDAILHMLTRIG